MGNDLGCFSSPAVFDRWSGPLLETLRPRRGTRRQIMWRGTLSSLKSPGRQLAQMHIHGEEAKSVHSTSRSECHHPYDSQCTV